MNHMKNIIEKARSQGNKINYLDVLKYLPLDIAAQDFIDDIILILNDMSVEVIMENAEIIEFPKNSHDK